MTGRMVYIIGSNGGPLKIGISSSPPVRLGQLQEGHPAKLSVMGSWQHNRARAVEVAAHRFLSAWRRYGEWFDVSLASAIDAVEQAIVEVDAQPWPPVAPDAPEEKPEPNDTSPHPLWPTQLARLIRIEGAEANEGRRFSRQEIIAKELAGDFGERWAQARQQQGWDRRL